MVNIFLLLLSHFLWTCSVEGFLLRMLTNAREFRYAHDMKKALNLYRRILEDGVIGTDIKMYADVLYDVSELYESKVNGSTESFALLLQVLPTQHH